MYIFIFITCNYIYCMITCNHKMNFVVLVQSLNPVLFFATSRTTAQQASLSFTISQSLLKLLSIKTVMLPNHLILCCPLLLLPSIFSSISLFQYALIILHTLHPTLSYLWSCHYINYFLI